MNETEQMLTAILNCRRDELKLNSLTLTHSQQHIFDTMKKRRQAGEPLQYILGDCDFMGNILKVDGRVLIPRPETEILVELIQNQFKDHKNDSLRILDLGTGSGNIPIALAKHFKNAHITAVDKSADALILAEENAVAHNVKNQIRFICGDMENYLSREVNPADKFDMIVSNPPYISTRDLDGLPEDVKQEPQMALDGGEDGLDFYRVIICQCAHLLKDNGKVFFEIGDGQSEAVCQMFQDKKIFEKVQSIKDYRETERIILASLRAQ